MTKIYIILFCIIFVSLGCNSDNIVLSLLTVEVPNESVSQQRHIILTDKNGVTLENFAFPKDTVFSLEGEFDLSNNQYHATFLHDDAIGQYDPIGTKNRNLMVTFLDVSPQTINLGRQNRNIYFADVVYRNMNVIEQAMELSGNTYVYYPTLYIEETFFPYSIYAEENVGNSFVFWQKYDEAFFRYIWLQDVIEDEEIDFNYNDIDKMDKISVNYPGDNYKLEQKVYGSVQSDNNYYEIGYGYGEVGNSLELNYPSDIFNSYITHSILEADEKVYESRLKSSEIKNTYELNQLDFETLNTDISDYRMQSDSDFDIVELSIEYLDPNSDYVLDWTIFGKVDSEFNIDLTSILEAIPDADQYDMNEIKVTTTKVIKSTEFKTYEKYIQEYFDRRVLKRDNIFESLEINH